MRYQFDITITEEDYLAFNLFHSFESPHGKKTIRNTRLLILGIMGLLLILYVSVTGWTQYSILYVLVAALFTTIYVAYYKNVFARLLKKQIKGMRKTGKLPFDEVSKFEFYEDRIVETATSSRVEKGYDTLERVYVFEDRYIFLYINTVSAYILPIPQIREQADQQEFLTFLSEKCNTVEYY